MSGLDNKDRFQQRLDRIQRENGGGPPPKGPSAPKPTRRKGGGGKRLVGLGVLVGFVLGIFGAGIYAVDRFNGSVDIPLRQIANDFLTKTVARTPTPASYDGLLTSGPKERRQYDTGWELPSPYVAAPGRTDLMLEQVAVAVEGAQNAASPTSEVVSFPHNTSCTLRRPRPNESVHNVRLNDTARYTHTHVFSKPELAKAVYKRIEGITRSPKHYKNAAIAKGRMGYVDVFVTDTSAPVYLVLQTFNRDVLWNIHLAQGVTLSHVALIGNKSGFAAPEGSFSFESLRIEDFVEEEMLYRNAEMRPCMIAPWNRPDPDWPLMQKLDHERDASHYRKQLETLTQGHAAFASWYSDQLGVDTDHNLTTALKAAHALVGPILATPVPMKPIRERVLHIAQNDYVTFGEAQLLALHDNLLLAATGGDLSILTPGPVEVAQK